MPRNRQNVQVKKRQKSYRPGELSGDTAHIKPKGAFKIFSNYKLFAFIGVAVLATSFIVTALLRRQLAEQRRRQRRPRRWRHQGNAQC